MSDTVNPAVIYISPKTKSKIMEYAQAADGEISGFGRINRTTGIFDKVFPLLPQKCNHGETEMDAEFLNTFTTSGQSSDFDVWWHSHGMGGCFWSGQDSDCIKLLGLSFSAAGNIPRPLLSIVVNKKREYKARVDIFKPVRLMADIELVTYYEFPHEEITKIRAEVKEKVATMKTAVTAYQPDKTESKKRTFLDFKNMTPDELGRFGYKVVGNSVMKMTNEEIIAFWKERKSNGKNRGSEDSALSLFGLDEKGDTTGEKEWG